MSEDFPSPVRPAGSTAEVFLGYLAYFRARITAKVRRLSEDERRQSRLPSGWTPVELVKHLTFVELRWLEWGFSGCPVQDPWGDRRDGRWYVAAEETTEELLSALHAQGSRSAAIIESNDLTAVGRPGPRWEGAEPATLERVLFHLLQEYARHLGHLDIVAELAGGPTGELRRRPPADRGPRGRRRSPEVAAGAGRLAWTRRGGQNGVMNRCHACELVARRDAAIAPARDAIARTPGWDVAHSFDTSVEGWTVLVLRRHAASVAGLTDQEAAELGPLLKAVSAALAAVTGCERTYVAQFAESPLHRHVHFHVVPRAADLAEDQRGPRIFAGLGRPEGERVPEARMEQVAFALRRELTVRGVGIAAAAPASPPSGGAPFIPLPEGLPDPRRSAGAVFDRIADLYDRARPLYPACAVEDLIRSCGLTSSSRIVEVGCGTGQLTVALAGTGARILAVEPGPALAARARDNLAGSPAVEVRTTRFEDLDAAPGSFDLVVAATSFHWVDPAIGYPKAAGLLRPGGSLALLTNAHTAGGSHAHPPFADAVRRLHHHLAPEIGDWTFPTAEEIAARAAGEGDMACLWARIDRNSSEPADVSGWFETPAARCYPWMATYDREAYLDMLASQSSYALMEPDRRQALLAGIGSLVEDLLGGWVTKQYVTVLAIARAR